jgi:hypothetical protein
MTIAALNSPKDHALYYRDELGFSVVALKTEPAAKRKEPAVYALEPYLKRKPTDEEIDQWFSINPNSNIGIPMGSVSNAVAFDVDGPTAVKRIEAVIPEMSSNLHEALANTMKNRTGSGSEHVIFRIEEPIDDITKKIIWSDGLPHSQILMLCNNCYVVGAPSLHLNNNRYEWNGKAPQLITRQELNEFIRLVGSDQITTKKHSSSNRPQTQQQQQHQLRGQRTLSPEQMHELLSWLKPYYTPGTRDSIIFHLSGMMRKDAGFPLSNARAFIELLCNESGYQDEDLDKSLQVLNSTYKKEDLGKLNGKSGLHEVLVTSVQGANRDEYLARTETYSQICQIINGPSSSSSSSLGGVADSGSCSGGLGDGGGGGEGTGRAGHEKLPDGCIMMELINRSPETYAAVIKHDNDYFNPTTGAWQSLRAIQEIQIERSEDKNGNAKAPIPHYKHIILNAIPIPPVEKIFDPLFEQTKYRIRFEYVGPGNTVIEMDEPIGPYTKEELKQYLLERTDWVYRQRLLDDTLNQVLKGYSSRQGMVKITTEIETEGLVWIPKENRLTLSKWTRYKPTPEEARECVKVLLDLQGKSYQPTVKRPHERKRFAHFIKIGLVSIVDFARRQCGAVASHGFIPRQDLGGWSKSGKTYGYAGLALRMYRLPLYGKTKYVIGSGSVETEARLIHHTKITTLPMILDDADFFADWQRNDQAKRCLSIMKYGTENTNPRDILTQDSKSLDLPLCAFPMITHNSDLIDEDGFIRRSTGHEFTKDDEKTEEEIKAYQEFFDRHGDTFAFLGDFAINYYLDDPQILYNDWLTIAKTILQQFFIHAGMGDQTPDWLLNEVVDSSTSQAKLAEDRSAKIAAALHDIIQNQGWYRNKREAAIWICKNMRTGLLTARALDYQTDSARNDIDDVMATATLQEKVKALTAIDALPFFRWHDEYEVCITAPVIEELKKHGITRVSHTQLPSYCEGFQHGTVRIGKKTCKAVHAKLTDFIGFINPTK